MQTRETVPPNGRKLYDLLTQAALKNADQAKMAKVYDCDAEALLRWSEFERAVFLFCRWAGDRQT